MASKRVFTRILPIVSVLAVMTAIAVSVPVQAGQNTYEDMPQLRLRGAAVPVDDGMPSLETPDMANQDDYMTPVSDVMDANNMLETPAVMEQDMTTWDELKSGHANGSAEAMLDTGMTETVKKKDPAESFFEQELSPAVDFTPPAVSGKQDNSQSEKTAEVRYMPLQAVAVFPVVRHRYERAFGDLPVLFSREFALKMEAKVPQTRVFNPVYTVEELKVQGLGHIYDEVMDFYKKAGRPEPAALDYLMERLNEKGQQPVARVIFVEADLDMSHTSENTGWLEKFKGLATDDLPKQAKYFVRSRVQVFNAQEPGYPMIWAYSTSDVVPGNAFYNVTPSVFADSESQMAFARTSRKMSDKTLGAMPQAVYLEPQVDTGVKGELVSERSGIQGLMPDSLQGLTQGDRNILRRILSRDEE